MAAWASVAVALVGTAYSAYSSEQASADQREAAKEAQALANLNAQAAQAENVEDLRRTERQQQSDESMARAKAAASGVDISTGSTGGYLQEMQAENELQLDWMQRSGLARVEVTKRGGQAAYNTGMAQASATRSQGISTAIGGLGSAAGTVAGMYTKPSTTTTTADHKVLG